MHTRLLLPCSAIAAAAMLLVPAPAGAQISAPSDPTFLTAGMAQATPQATATQSSGGGGGGIGFGVKGGWLYNSFDSASESLDTTNGWEVGIFFGGNRNGVVGVMGEILYAKKTVQPNKSLSGPIDLYYLEIPVLLRINIGSANKNKGAIFYGLVGPVFDVNLQAKQEDLDVKDNYESLDVGILGGAGVEISRFIVEARYNWGLMNLLNVSKFVDEELKSQSFAVLFGVRIN
jgi:Outer membrane protein beta-barrel domain